ncbi:MAG TPA: hypothetical protein VIL39_05595 [Verrucomicrobiae bacterium]
MTRFEYDAGRAATARANFKKAGVDQVAMVVQDDADKKGYTDYLTKLQPL